MKAPRTLACQIVLLVGCAVLLVQLALEFPYPAPVVRPFLGAKERWPEAQVRAWAKTRDFRTDFWDFFTRDPQRVIPPGDDIVAPADGLLRYHDRAAGKQYVVIALSFWDVHVQRVPCDGVVTQIEDAGDTFQDAEGKDMVYLREKVCPVQKIVTLQTRWGEFKVRLITSLAARRLEVWVDVGQKVAKGERLGRILAGSTVVLEMPESVPVHIEKGTRVVGGETALGGR